MVSRPLLRILPLVATAAAFLGASSPALAAGDAAPVCVPFTQSVAPYPASREVVILKPLTFCTDPDRDLLTYSVTTNGLKGDLDTSNIAQSSFTYTPKLGATGDDNLTLVAIDPAGARSQPVTITMRITSANQAPICLDDPVVYPVAKNKPQLLSGHCYDPDEIDNTAGHVGLYNTLPPSNGNASPAGTGFNYVPNHDYLGPDTIHYTMTDAEGATSVNSGSTLVNVVTANVPTCSPPPTLFQRVGKDITFQTTCADAAGSPLSAFTYALVSGAAPQSDDWINHNDGTFTLHPQQQVPFDDSFSYTATNFAGTSLPVNISVHYQTGFNSAPVCESLNPEPMFAHASRPATFQFECADAQGDPVSVVGANGTHGTLDPPVQTPGTNIWTAVYHPSDPNYEGSDTISITPHDDQPTGGIGQAVAVDFSVISDANELAPTCDPGSFKVHNNDTQGAVYAPACSDAENDTLTATLGSGPGEAPLHGTVTGPDGNGAFTYVPSSVYVGPDAFVVHVSDAIKTTIVNVAVTVLPPNHPPVCSNLSLPADHTAVSTFDLLSTCSDPDAGDSITAVLDSATTHGTLSGVSANGHVTYRPTPGFAGGDDTFTFHVFDTSGATSGTMTATVHVDRLPTCTAPTPSPALVAHNKTLSITPCTDADGDVLSYTSIVDPAHGTLSSVAGHLVYTPVTGYAGLDTFQVQADDHRGGVSATLQVDVKVAGDGAPTCTAHTYTIPTGTSQAVPLGCTDPDGDTVTPSIVRPPAHGFLSVIKNGSVTYTPTAGFGGADSFTYRGTDSDPSKLTSPQVTVSFTVTGGTSPIGPVNTVPIPPTISTPSGPTTPVKPPTPKHGVTLKEIAEKILKHPATQVDVGFGRTTVPAFVATGVGSTLKVTGRSSVFLVYFCTCTITVNQVMSGGGTPHSASAKKGTTVKSTLNLAKLQASKITVKLSAAQYKALTKGGSITLKVTFTTTGPKPKNKKQKAKTVKKVRTWHVKAAKAKTKAKR